MVQYANKRERGRKQMTVTIKWSAEDIQAIRPNLTLEQAEELLDTIGESLKDRSIEIGWEIMETLITLEGESK